MTPQKGDTVRVLTGQWKGWTGEVVDVWTSGAVSIRIVTERESYRRTFYGEEVEVIR